MARFGMRGTRRRRLWAAAAVLAASLAASAAGLAAPSELEGKRAEAERVLAEIQAIDAELDLAVDAWNGANERLQRLRATVLENRRHLAIAREAYRTAQARLAERLVALYTNGEESVLEVILGAASLDEIIDRIDAAKRVSDQDAEIVEEVRRVRRELAAREQKLERALAEQERAVAERAAKREAIEAKLAERERLHASIVEEIARLEAEERERQRRLREEARRLEAERAQAAAAEAPAGVPAAADAGGAPPGRYGSAVVEIAMRYLGVPYVWGGASPDVGFDCSGLVMYVYAQVGVSLPHNAAMQYGYGVPVSRDELQPGDLVFFNDLGHNGIYVGNGLFIQAPRTGDVVKISSLSEPWYAATWVGARRIL